MSTSCRAPVSVDSPARRACAPASSAAATAARSLRWEKRVTEWRSASTSSSLTVMAAIDASMDAICGQKVKVKVKVVRGRQGEERGRQPVRRSLNARKKVAENTVQRCGRHTATHSWLLTSSVTATMCSSSSAASRPEARTRASDAAASCAAARAAAASFCLEPPATARAAERWRTTAASCFDLSCRRGVASRGKMERGA